MRKILYAGIVMIIILLSLVVIASSTNKIFEKDSSYKKDSVNSANLGKITLSEGSKKIAEYTLIRNSNQCLVNCYAEGTAYLYEKGKLFDSATFKDLKSKSKSIDYRIYIEESYTQSYNEKYINCESSPSFINCAENDAPLKTVTNTRWKLYNGEQLEGFVRWRIEANKPIKEAIDWIVTSNGIQLSDWAWWNSSWGNRRVIEIQGPTSETLYNFTVAINVSRVSGMATDYRDVRFIFGNCSGNQNEELNYEKMTNGTSMNSEIFFVKMPNMTAGWSSNNMMCMYYNNPTATDGSDPINSYDFKHIYHFETNTSSNIIDTMQNNNCTFVGEATIINGTFGNAISGGVMNMTCGDTDFIAGGKQMALLAIVSSIKELGSIGRLIEKDDFDVKITNTDKFEVGINADAKTATDAASYTQGTKYHIGGVYNTTDLLLYKNGVIVGDTATTLAVTNYASFLRLGGAYQQNWNGTIDEIWIDNKTRSTEWMERWYQLENYTKIRTSNPDWTWTEVSISFTSSAYETYEDTYTLTFDYNNVVYTGLSAELVYNNTRYSASASSNNGTRAVFSKSVGAPVVSTSTSKQFYFDISLTNTTGIINHFNSSFNNQTINPILLTICNATYVYPFINFTFQDEKTETAMNSSISGLSAVYWASSASSNKTYSFSNATANPSYAFCFSPSYASINANFDFSFYRNGNYNADTYPNRRFSGSFNLTNSTTAKTLYLLSNADGSSATFQVQTTQGSPLSSVTVTMERQFGTTWTTIGQDTTDSAGSVTFWVNPNELHRFTFSKTGYASNVMTIRPTQSLYTVMLAGSYNGTFSYSLKGIDWKLGPPSGLVYSNQTYHFFFNVTASLDNLISCKLEIKNSSNYVLAINSVSCLGSANISIDFNTSDYPSLFGYFSIDTGGGYFQLDSTKYYTSGNNVSTPYSLISFFKLIARYDNTWGASNIRNVYTKVTIFFFALVLLLGIGTFFTGFDIREPGYAIFIVWCALLFGSVAGWFNPISASGNTSGYPIFDQYSVFIIITLIMLGYFFNRWSQG